MKRREPDEGYCMNYHCPGDCGVVAGLSHVLGRGDAYSRDLSPEEQDAEYLCSNPSAESYLWGSWVSTVCDWRKIDQPTRSEWVVLRGSWYPGKAPVNSVDELQRLRGARRSRATTA